MNLKGKKLMVMCGTALSCEIVEVAKKMGVYTMVTDYIPNSPAKKIADESFDVSTTDIDAMVSLCKEKKVDGIFTNFIDSMLPYCLEICKHLNKPFYLNEEQIKVFGEKKNFKKACIESGVAVPQEFKMTEDFKENDFKKIIYPVIVKPVDSSGSKGISVCYSETELKNAFKHALEYSKSKNVVVEKYFTGDEVTVNYVMQDGEVMLTSIHDRYFNTEQVDVLKTPDVYIYPSKYVKEYLKSTNLKVIKMLKKWGFKDGSIFLQACVENNEFYFYEAGIRLNGCKIYQLVDAESDYNALKHMICYALTGSMGKPDIKEKINPIFKNWYATLSILSNPGVIGKIDGINEIKEMPEVVGVTPWYWEGDEIKNEYRGTLLQTIIRVSLKGKTKEELAKSIEKIYQTYKAYDKNGKNMLLKQRKYNDIINILNYEL